MCVALVHSLTEILSNVMVVHTNISFKKNVFLWLKLPQNNLYYFVVLPKLPQNNIYQFFILSNLPENDLRHFYVIKTSLKQPYVSLSCCQNILKTVYVYFCVITTSSEPGGEDINHLNESLCTIYVLTEKYMAVSHLFWYLHLIIISCRFLG